MKKLSIGLLAALLTIGGMAVQGASAGNVMLLGDTEAETQVQTALENAGHSVTFAGLYYEWDGETPDVGGFDVVVFLDGEDYGVGLLPAAETALVDFVQGGGGLIVTEWMLYDIYYDTFGEAFGALMPVEFAEDYDYDPTWTVTDAGHMLTAGLPATWFDGNGYSFVTARAGAVVVIENESGNPMLTYTLENGGPVIHLNHDMTYTTDTINAHSLQALVNCVDFACHITPTETTTWSRVKSLY